MSTNKLLLACFLLVTTAAFAQQADMSLIPYRQGDKWGYSTPDRKIVIDPKYNEVNWFSEGYAAVKVGNKYGYINKIGQLVIPAKYTVAKPFRKGYVPNVKKEGGDSVLFAGASLVANGEEICIDTKGIRLYKCPAINENSVLENVQPLETIVTQKNYSLTNNSGLFDKVVDDYKIPGSDEIYYIAIKNNQYGVFNSKFDMIIPFQFSSIKMNHKAAVPYLEVNRSGMYGILMADGTTGIAPEYSKLNAIDGPDGKEYIVISKDGKSYLRDITNKDIIPNGFTNIVYENGGFILTGDNNLVGYYSAEKGMIQPKYIDIRSVGGTKYLAIKTFNGKTGYINTAGDEYFVE